MRYTDDGGGLGFKAVASAGSAVPAAVHCAGNADLDRGHSAGQSFIANALCNAAENTLLLRLNAASILNKMVLSGLAPQHIAVDSDGTVALAATFGSQVTVGPDTYTPDGIQDGVLVVLDEQFSVQWSVQIGGASAEGVDKVAFGPKGNILVAGNFTGNFALVPSWGSAESGADVFVLAFDKSTEALVWSRRFGNDSTVSVKGMSVTGSGELIVGIHAQGTLDLGNGVEILAGVDSSPAVLSLAAPTDGATRWGRAFPSDSAVLGGIDVTAAGLIAMAGYAGGPIELAEIHPGQSLYGPFVALLANDGTPLWSRADGGPMDEAVALGVSVGEDGAIYLAGWTAQTIGVGLGLPQNQTPNGHDVWAARFDP